MLEEDEEEVRGQGERNHPLVLDGDHAGEFDGLSGIIRLNLNHESMYDNGF